MTRTPRNPNKMTAWFRCENITRERRINILITDILFLLPVLIFLAGGLLAGQGLDRSEGAVSPLPPQTCGLSTWSIPWVLISGNPGFSGRIPTRSAARNRWPFSHCFLFERSL